MLRGLDYKKRFCLHVCLSTFESKDLTLSVGGFCLLLFFLWQIFSIRYFLSCFRATFKEQENFWMKPTLLLRYTLHLVFFLIFISCFFMGVYFCACLDAFVEVFLSISVVFILFFLPVLPCDSFLSTSDDILTVLNTIIMVCRRISLSHLFLCVSNCIGPYR